MKNFTNKMAAATESCAVRAVLRLLISCMFVLVAGCDAMVSLLPGVRQIATSANIYTIGSKIEYKIESQNGYISAAEAEQEVKAINNGYDEWGNPIMLIIRERGETVDFLVISFGSDGALEVRNPDAYFHAEKMNVTGDYAADLVYRKGGSVRYAHK